VGIRIPRGGGSDSILPHWSKELVVSKESEDDNERREGSERPQQSKARVGRPGRFNPRNPKSTSRTE
jgi:hypothetical protein